MSTSTLRIRVSGASNGDDMERRWSFRCAVLLNVVSYGPSVAKVLILLEAHITCKHNLEGQACMQVVNN